MTDTYGWPSTMTAIDPHDDLDMDSDWQRLVAPEHLPPAIRAHLRAERGLLASVLRTGGYRVVIEAGCADGSLCLPVVLSCGLDYIGVDVVAQAAAATRRAITGYRLRPGQRAVAVHGDARALQAIDGLGRAPERPLVVLPFNLFGIVSRPYEMLQSAAAIGADVLILTYRLTPEASAARARYFTLGGWPGSEVELSDGVHYQGDHFISSVYSPETLRRWLVEAGFQPTMQPFGDIGLAASGALRVVTKSVPERHAEPVTRPAAPAG
jgi:hypothetical protein